MIWLTDPNIKANPRFHTCFDVPAETDVTPKMKFAFRCAVDVDGVWKLEGGLFDGVSLKGVPAPEHDTLDDCKAEAQRCCDERR